MSVFIKKLDNENRSLTLASDDPGVTAEYIIRPHRDNSQPDSDDIKWVVAKGDTGRQLTIVNEEEDGLTCEKAVELIKGRLETEERRINRATTVKTQEADQLSDAIANLFPDFNALTVDTVDTITDDDSQTLME